MHWGQRKLLISEILFLTSWGDKSNEVVYAGAAPGFHIPFLSALFPRHSFILYDPSAIQIKETQNIRIRQEFFTTRVAQTFADRKVLFISDVRSRDSKSQDGVTEACVWNDNEAQKEWVLAMKPAKAMLKFRCPYPTAIPGKTSMLRGTPILQPWAPANSTETRLVVDDSLQTVDYDHLMYEEQLCYHNIHTRARTFHLTDHGNGFKGSFDACAELLVLSDFLLKFPDFGDGRSIESISKLSKRISSELQ